MIAITSKTSAFAKWFLIVFNCFIFWIGIVYFMMSVIMKLYPSLVLPWIEELLIGLQNLGAGSNLADIPSTVPDTLEVGKMTGDFTTCCLLLGVIAMGLGAFGVYCTWFSSVCGLATYAGIMFVGILMQVAFVMGFSCQGNMAYAIDGWMQAFLEEDYGGLTKYNLESILANVIMIKAACCGVYGYKDFEKAEHWQNSRIITTMGGDISHENVTLVTPVACCVMNGTFPTFPDIQPADDTCFMEPTDLNNNWKKGCLVKLADYVNANTPLILGMGVLKIICTALIFGSTIFLIKSIREKNKIKDYNPDYKVPVDVASELAIITEPK